MSYVIAVEKFAATYDELEPLYRQHYKEMTDRLAVNGITYSPYNPRLAVDFCTALRRFCLWVL